ncbi:MAG: S9 family peptidase [Chlorobi bacterium]|nr:S9 family peptidase [Chlorobiota bacterium]
MHKNIIMSFIVLAMFGRNIMLCQTTNKNTMSAPIAKKQAKIFNEFGNQRIDNYYWLNERENPEVIEYLKTENSYTKEFMKDTENLQETIFDEIVGRIKQDDQSVPFLLKGYKYYNRYAKGGEHPVYCRIKNHGNPTEQIMLDGNKMAEGLAFFNIGGWEISENNNILAYCIDSLSRRKYTIHFKNLETGEILKDNIKNTSGNICWANDNKTIYYTVKDESLRPYKIYKHVLGDNVGDDELIYHEADPTFTTYVYKTKSEKFIVIGCESTTTDEYRILDANDPKGGFEVFSPRKKGVEYSIYHQGNRFLVKTNYKARNFRIMECSETATNIDKWTGLSSHYKDVLIEDIDVFEDFYVVSERKNGLIFFRIVDLKNNKENYISFGEPDYYAFGSTNAGYKSNRFRFGYTSLKTPRSIYDFDMETGKRQLLKEEEVVGGYNPDDYVTERLYAESRDGLKVPVSIVYKKGFKKDGHQPLLLYGYGSYGYSIESSFRSPRLSLLDRGFAFAIAHIRGGEELGRKWYQNGKLLHKKHTFFDFIDVADFLIEKKYTSKENIFAYGGSAGGLLIGAVINFRPDLFKAVIAAVPFVDVMTTMLDESIPLTTGEYDEWGNPNEEKYYDYMLSYSPYDNVEARDYPAMLVTTGLHDSQVQYWEPAKWVAKLRDLKTDKNPLLLKTNMDFGHAGASGRFEVHKDTALEYAFLLMMRR